METRCLPPSDGTISFAASLITKGELVAFPTETVYGLGADALNAKAVLSIFAAKNRPADNPLIVHITSRDSLSTLCYVTNLAQMLMDAFWPGPLTLLMKKKAIVPDATTAGLDTVAVRMPDHPVAKALIDVCGCPIAAPSANLSGRPSPTLAAHVLEDMAGRIPLIIDGGACGVGLESTVVDTTGDVPLILRPGGITPEMIFSVAGSVNTAHSILSPLQPGEAALSPGMRHKHYAPAGCLTLVSGNSENVARVCNAFYDEAVHTGKSACILSLSEHVHAYDGRYVLDIGSMHHPEETASRLFDILRRMDRENISSIFSEVTEASGLGLAVMNRLGRAASFHYVDADKA